MVIAGSSPVGRTKINHNNIQHITMLLNSIEISTLLCLFLVHWIGDYLLQTRAQGNGKSSSNKFLLEHTITYSAFLGFGVFTMGLLFNTGIPIESIVQYAVINFVLHTATDWVTSRVTKSLWTRRQEWATFAVMGFDQMTHMVCLTVTYGLLK